MIEPDGYDDGHDDDCIADDSTECDCSSCTEKEERFWREQEGRPDDVDDLEYEDDSEGRSP